MHDFDRALLFHRLLREHIEEDVHKWFEAEREVLNDGIHDVFFSGEKKNFLLYGNLFLNKHVC